MSMARLALVRIFNREVWDEERGESGHGDEKVGKRNEAPHRYSGVGVSKKRESSSA